MKTSDFWLILFVFILLAVMITANAVLTFVNRGFYYTHIIDLVALSAGIYLLSKEFKS